MDLNVGRVEIDPKKLSLMVYAFVKTALDSMPNFSEAFTTASEKNTNDAIRATATLSLAGYALMDIALHIQPEIAETLFPFVADAGRRVSEIIAERAGLVMENVSGRVVSSDIVARLRGVEGPLHVKSEKSQSNPKYN